MNKQNNGEKEAIKKADRAIRRLPQLLKTSSNYFDPKYNGMALILPYGYICIRPGIKHVYAYRTASLDPEEEVPALSPPEHRRLMAFLEACAQHMAIMYRRDAFGFLGALPTRSVKFEESLRLYREIKG